MFNTLNRNDAGAFHNPPRDAPAIALACLSSVEVKFGRLRIEPEFRYTRWGSQAFQDSARVVLSTNLNQGDFILGLLF